MSEMISFGAGVNSVAMTVMLIEEGWRGPIVFADTGGEWPETYCYLEYFERQFLKPRGLSITRLSPKTHASLYDDKRLGLANTPEGLYPKHPVSVAVEVISDNILSELSAVNTLEDYCLMWGIIPLLSVRWCSVRFKRTPLVNWQKNTISAKPV